MLLPQSSAFATLQNRLNSVSSIGLMSSATRTGHHERSKALGTRTKVDDMKWTELLDRFRQIQVIHERLRRVSPMD